MTGEHADEEFLIAFVAEGELTDKVRTHITGCEQCMQQAAKLNKKLRLIDFLADEESNADSVEEIPREMNMRIFAKVNPIWQQRHRKRFRVVIWLARVAAVALVLAVSLGAKSYYDLTRERDDQVRKYGDLRAQLGLNRYVTFASDGENHPSTDPKNARPIYVVGRELVLKGTALPHLIQAIEIRSEPSLGPGETWWEEKLPIQREGQEEFVAFHRAIAAPTDGKLRKVTIRLIPQPKAKVDSPEDFREDRLTYEVLVACLPAGPIAYAPPEPVSLNVPSYIDGNTTSRDIEGVSLRDGYLVLLVRVKDQAAQPWYVQNLGKPLRIYAGQPFSVGCVFGIAARKFEIKALVLPTEKDWPFIEQNTVSDNDIPTIDRQGRKLERAQSYTVTRQGP
jgi:hypothetical protein